MSAKTIVHRSTLFAAAAALVTAGSLVGPAAHADQYSCSVNPNVPFLVVRVHPPGSEYEMQISAKGSSISGDVQSRWLGGDMQNAVGSVSSGVIAGTAINFIVDWSERSGGGATHFRGTVGSDGIAHGSATGSKAHEIDNPNQIEFAPGEWETTSSQLTCPTAGNPGPATGQKIANVVSDVDVYDKKNEPDGAGTLIGILRAGNKVTLLGPCQQKSWCNVSGDAVPGGSGWVWGALDV